MNQSQNKDQSLFPILSAFQEMKAGQVVEETPKKIKPKVASQLDIEDIYYKLTQVSHMIKDNKPALDLVNEVADELYRNLR